MIDRSDLISDFIQDLAILLGVREIAKTEAEKLKNKVFPAFQQSKMAGTKLTTSHSVLCFDKCHRSSMLGSYG